MVSVLSKHSKTPASAERTKLPAMQLKNWQHSVVEKSCWQAACCHRLSVNIKQLFLAKFVVDYTGKLHCFQHRLWRTSVDKSGTVRRCNLPNCLILIASRIYNLSMAGSFFFCSTFGNMSSAGLQRQSHLLYFHRDIRNCPHQQQFYITPYKFGVQ